MSAHERLFVLALEPTQAQHIDLLGLDGFDTQVPQETDSPALGRVALVVTGDTRAPGWHVTGLAVVESAGRGGTFHRRLRVRGLRRVDADRVNQVILRQHLAEAVYDVLNDAVRRRAAELTEARSRSIGDALRQLAPGVLEAVLAELSPPLLDTTSVGRWQQEADAVRLVLRAAALDAEVPAWQPPARDEPFLAGLVGDPHEATLIDNDVRMIPGWQEVIGASTRPDIHVFGNEHRRIEILNANATRAEAHLGVDLIYHLAPVEGFVMVQYKKLIKDTSPVDDRFHRQLARMRRVVTLGSTPKKSVDYRLGPRTSCFVKLVHAREFDPTADRMMKGMYLPLEFVDLVLADGTATGSRGSATLGYENVSRHLTDTQFTQLRGAGWIGTTGVTRQQLLDTAKETLTDQRSLVLAADSGELTSGPPAHSPPPLSAQRPTASNPLANDRRSGQPIDCPPTDDTANHETCRTPLAS